MAAAQKLRPAATQHASSPVGRPRLQSLFTAQESKGRQTSVLGASALERLAYSAPCAAHLPLSLHAAPAVSTMLTADMGRLQEQLCPEARRKTSPLCHDGSAQMRRDRQTCGADSAHPDVQHERGGCDAIVGTMAQHRNTAVYWVHDGAPSRRERPW